MPTIHLTEGQLNTILKEQQGFNKLTEEELEVRAKEMARERNFPFVKEENEWLVYKAILRKVDHFLFEHVPPELYAMVKESRGEMEENERKKLADKIAKYANEKIDMPYLPEVAEKVVLKMVVLFLLNLKNKKE